MPSLAIANTPTARSPYATAGETLVDMGYAAIPVLPGSKRPGSMSYGKWFGDLDWSRYCDRMPTPIEASIWARWPDAGVCVALDKTLKVIDIDTDDQEIIDAVVDILPKDGRDVRKKGAKGVSIFFRGSDAIENRPFNLVLAGGHKGRVIDLLCYGRQTVLPPTLHPDLGRPYVWVTDDTLENTGVEELPLLPDDIAAKLAAALEPFGEVEEFKARPATGVEVFGETIWREVNDYAMANLDLWVPHLPAEAETKRDRAGNYRMKAFWRGVENANVGVHSTGIVDWGGGEKHTPIDLVMNCHQHPYFEMAYEWLAEKTGYRAREEDWIQSYHGSAMNLVAKAKAQMAHGCETSAPCADEPEEPKRHEIRAPRARLDPFTPAAAGGILGAISTWCLDTARRPVPEFALLSAIGFMSALFGRRCVGPTGLGLNLYMIGVAGPGFGKEHALKTIQTLAYDCKVPDIIGPSEVTSGSAIEKVLRRRPVFVMPWDEVGVVLQSVNGGGASAWAKTIRKVLLEVYSKSTGMWSGKEHADPMKDSSSDPIHCPTVSLLGMSTPTTFYKGLTEDSLTDGFIARLTVVEAKVRPDRGNAPPLLMTPASLIDAIKSARENFPQDKMAAANSRNPAMKPALYTVPWADDAAERRWIAIEDWQYEQIEEHGASDGIIGRAAEQTIKLATIRAISSNPRRPQVTLDDVEWGYAIVQRSIDSIDSGTEEYMAGSQFEELCKAITRALRDTKTGELPQSQLVRKKGVSKADDRMVKGALDRLTMAGVIYKPTVDGRGIKVKLRAD